MGNMETKCHNFYLVFFQRGKSVNSIPKFGKSALFENISFHFENTI